MTTKKFPLCDVLTVTTGRLLTKRKGPNDNGISSLYALLAWMTDDEPFTHQLGRFAEECKPHLLRWFPDLAQAEDALLRLDSALNRIKGMPDSTEDIISAWMESLGLPDTFDIPRIPKDDHTVKDGYDELVEMRGTDENIIVVKEKDNDL